MAKHFLHAGKLPRGGGRCLLLPGVELFLFLRGQFGLTFHLSISFRLAKPDDKSLARAVQLAANRIGGLPRQRAHLFITQFFIGYQQ